MKKNAIIIVLVLLFGLIFVSYLGNNREGLTGQINGTFNIDDVIVSSAGSSTTTPNKYDTYNHFNGQSSTLTPGTTLYGENGRTATIDIDSDGNQILKIILPGSQTPEIFKKEKVNISNSLQTAIKEAFSTNEQPNINKNTFYGSNGKIAELTTSSQPSINVKMNDGVTTSYSSTGPTQNQNQSQNSYTSTQYFGSTGTQLSPFNNYSSSLPVGIKKTDIPVGQENLYILKTEIVPPVCPVCPNINIASLKKEQCPPCPACERCPESKFECKKVPKYDTADKGFLPNAVLSNYTQFGM